MNESLTQLVLLVANSTRAVYPSTPRYADAEGPSVVDVHFFRCVVGESFDRDRFRELLRAALADSHSEFNTITEDRAARGPSYIEWGAWLGSQDVALRLLTCGQVAELWTVITPATLHVTGAEADQLAGRGMVMNGGLTWPAVADEEVTA